MPREIYQCKCHGKDYHVCTTCGHLYCADYWRKCPRCTQAQRQLHWTAEEAQAVIICQSHGFQWNHERLTWELAPQE